MSSPEPRNSLAGVGKEQKEVKFANCKFTISTLQSRFQSLETKNVLD